MRSSFSLFTAKGSSALFINRAYDFSPLSCKLNLVGKRSVTALRAHIATFKRMSLDRIFL